MLRSSPLHSLIRRRDSAGTLACSKVGNAFICAPLLCGQRYVSDSFKVGTVLDWKLFKGYGFIQENISGAQHFCPRKATNGALFLRPGDPVRFEIEETSAVIEEDSNPSGLPRCKNVTQVNGAAFECEELQGIVMEVPVPSKAVVGLIRRVGKWSPSMSATTATTHSHHAASASSGFHDSAFVEAKEEQRLYHYSFSHSKSLSVGAMVRFWSRENSQRRTAKDVVAVDPSILSPDELRLLQVTQRLVSQQATRSIASDVKFQHQQWQPLAGHAAAPAAVDGTQQQQQNSSDASLPPGVLIGAPAKKSEVVDDHRQYPCVVAHFQGRYGKLRIINDEGQPLIIFFHADMVKCNPNKIVTGLKGMCSYERVRQGKNAGTLRASSVTFPERK